MPSATATSLYIAVIAAAFIASMATVHHDVPENMLKRHVYASPLPPEQPFVPKFDFTQAEYLRAHNALRQKIGVPLLIWSAKLTAQAQNWAEQRRVDCNYRTHSRNRHGENIFWMRYREKTPTEVVQWWYNEYEYYDNTTFKCMCQPERPGCECGHYLNVIWSTTVKVGCGFTYCVDQKGFIVVCEYDPAGLTPGINPFTGHPIDNDTPSLLQEREIGTQSPPQKKGIGAQSPPQKQGIGTQSHPQEQRIGTPSQPHTEGVGAQSQPQDQGVGTPSQPHEQGIGTQSEPHTERVGAQSHPHDQGVGAQTQPCSQEQGIGTQSQPQEQGGGISQ